MTARRPAAGAIVGGLVALALVIGLIALGNWQLHRRAWKHALIARVDARIHAPPVAAPARATEADAYLRVAARGRWIAGRDTLVQATTILGPGWWVMTPLATDDGFVLLVNRGFVPNRGARPPLPVGPVAVVGLLRASEPGGGFLRSNDPAHDHWYSRDVAAIARTRGLAPVAPYFIDAAASGIAGEPIGGLTVIRFPDNHLSYALTWYALALLVAGGYVVWLQRVRR